MVAKTVAEKRGMKGLGLKGLARNMILGLGPGI
jgi:hypothetical protein